MFTKLEYKPPPRQISHEVESSFDETDPPKIEDDSPPITDDAIAEHSAHAKRQCHDGFFNVADTWSGMSTVHRLSKPPVIFIPRNLFGSYM